MGFYGSQWENLKFSWNCIQLLIVYQAFKERVYKPDSVSLTIVVIHLERFLQISSSDLPKKHCRKSILFLLFGLAPSGVCNAIHIVMNAVSSYLAFSPLPN